MYVWIKITEGIIEQNNIINILFLSILLKLYIPLYFINTDIIYII